MPDSSTAARLPEFRGDPINNARAVGGRHPAVSARGGSDRAWDLLLGCLAAYVFFAVGRLHQLFPILEPLKLPLITGAAAIGLYLFQAKGARRFNSLAAPATRYLLLLLVWVALSVPGALYPGLAFTLLTGSFVKTVLLFVLIVGSVRGFRDVERLTFAYFAAAAIYAAVLFERFDVSGTSWRLSHLYYYDANDFCTFAVSALPLGLYFTFTQSRWSRRLLGAAGVFALLIGIVWSGSRGGFLALLAVGGFVLFRFTAIRTSWRVLGTAAFVVTILATASDAYWTQMRTIFKSDEDYNRTSEEGRVKIWKRGLGYMARHPVLGVGADNFTVAEGTISPLARQQEFGLGLRWNPAHNTYVQMGAELGVPGLLLMVTFLGAGFVSLARVSRRPRSPPQPRASEPQLAQALKASLVGWVVGAFFLSLAYADMVYALVALATALRKVTMLDQTRRPVPWLGP